MGKGPIELNPQFKTALALIENSSQNVFITGKAGTGKSTLLCYLQQVSEKVLAVLAPTGVAALNVQGETIHSFFGFKPGVTVEQARKTGRDNRDNELYKSIELIVIDEISMVRADLLDCIDVFLKAALRKRKPFGNLQIVFIGDLYQLPPVVTGRDRLHFEAAYESPYFFSASVVAGGKFKLELVELEKVYRQQDDGFIDLLNAVRNSSVSAEQLGYLNQRVDPECTELGPGTVYITTTNKVAENINRHNLSFLDTKPYPFRAAATGDFDLSTAPAAVELTLKAGAQVMFLTNNAEGLWVNGTVGTVEELDKDYVLVRTDQGAVVSVDPYKWSLYHYVFDSKSRALQQESIGTFTQLPLQLAWAITIHKSQGKTFDRVIIDLDRGTFAPGQAYVALSRCSSLEGLVLTKPVQKGHIWMDYGVVNFLTRFQYDLAEKRCSTGAKVKIIEAAIRDNRRLKITYLKPDDSKSTRTVVPTFVGDLQYQGKTYLGMEAWCRKRQANRVFRVDRILEIEKGQ